MATKKAVHEGFLRHALELAQRAALEYSDDRPIYEQLALPKELRRIRMRQLLRDEALALWKRYHAKPVRVSY